MPKNFTRIRHYGLLAGRSKNDLLPRCRQLLGAAEPEPVKEKNVAEWLLRLFGLDLSRCPKCGHQPLESIDLPPDSLSNASADWPTTLLGAIKKEDTS